VSASAHPVASDIVAEIARDNPSRITFSAADRSLHCTPLSLAQQCGGKKTERQQREENLTVKSSEQQTQNRPKQENKRLDPVKTQPNGHSDTCEHEISHLSFILHRSVVEEHQ